MMIPITARTSAYKAQTQFKQYFYKTQSAPAPPVNSPTVDRRTSFDASSLSLVRRRRSSGATSEWESKPSAISTTASFQKKDEKRVRFDDSSNTIDETISRKDMTQEELQDAFYSDVEQNYMFLAASLIADPQQQHQHYQVSFVDSGVPRDQQDGLRGLENLTRHGQIRSEVNIRSSVCAVLDQQENQFNAFGCITDEVAIANAYTQFTGYCQEVAVQRARSDEAEALASYSDYGNLAVATVIARQSKVATVASTATLKRRPSFHQQLSTNASFGERQHITM